jgi:putative FmdB family regulatory protein
MRGFYNLAGKSKSHTCLPGNDREIAMPIYEYQCDACEHKLEALQKISDTPLEVCPDCGKPALIKQVSAAGFRLKGSGWYETDFKKGAKKNLAGDKAKPSEAKASKSQASK